MVRCVEVFLKNWVGDDFTYNTSNATYLPLCMVVLPCGDDALLGADVPAEQLSCGAL